MIVISCVSRPHIVDDAHPCWCRPQIERCEEGDHTYTRHRYLDITDAGTEKMACFSEQIPFSAR